VLEVLSSVDDDVSPTLEEVALPIGEGVAISVDEESVAGVVVALSTAEDWVSAKLEEDSAIAEFVI
jgi:hypothetical protein